MNDNFDLVKKLIETPWYNLVLISILILPLFISVWITLIKNIGLELGNKQKSLGIIIFITIYGLGLTSGKIGVEKERTKFYLKYSNAIDNKINADYSKYKVLTYNQIKLSFPKLSTENIETIVEIYPERFEIVGIADHNDPSKALAEDPKGIHLLK